MNARFLTFLTAIIGGPMALHAQEKPGGKPALGGPRMQVPAPVSEAAVPTTGPISDPVQIVSAFFSLLQKSSVDAAYASLTRGSRIAEKPEELKLLKAKTHEAIEAFGAISGFDHVDTKIVGARLLRATYVSHGRVFPLRWRFYFYNPDGIWKLIDLRVDDKLTGIFDEPEERREPDGKP